MAIEWTPKLSVGIDLIDGQHKIWFDKANQLFEAGQNGRAKEYILQMFDFLDEYTKQHFADEKSIWQKSVIRKLMLRKRLTKALYQTLPN